MILIKDTSNFETERPLTISENEDVVGLMKDEFCGKIMAAIVGLRLIYIA